MLPAWAGVSSGARPPAEETLAGAWIASVGTELPSGSVGFTVASASAVPGPVPAMVAVQATDRTASGTRAMAFWPRPNRALDMSSSPAPSSRDVPRRPGCDRTNE
jgi:hypothetical protein